MGQYLELPEGLTILSQSFSLVLTEKCILHKNPELYKLSTENKIYVNSYFNNTTYILNSLLVRFYN